MLRRWEELPDEMRVPEVQKYYDILTKRRLNLVLKRVFDIVVSLIMLIVLAMPMLMISLFITMDSPGGIFYRQVRVTKYGKKFIIHKFRTMVINADKDGSLLTIGNDSRVTKVGRFLRKYRLDEFLQIYDIFIGNMSFVGARPEVPKYVEQYSNEMMATLLLPAGVTSEASIRYKDEAKLLDNADDVDKVYVEQILPRKMQYNLQAINKFSFFGEIVTILRTIFVVLGKDYNDDEPNMKLSDDRSKEHDRRVSVHNHSDI